MSEKKRILLVDDEPSVTRALERCLEEAEKYSVRSVNDAAKAAAEAGEFRPDLVVLDLVMPDVDGGEILAAIRGKDGLGSVPAIFLTGFVTEAEVCRFGAPEHDFPVVAKPMRADSFIGLVEETLDG